MFSLGEMLFLAILALVIVGPKQLPELARQVGRFINEMKRASSSLTDEFRVSNMTRTPPKPPTSPLASVVSKVAEKVTEVKPAETKTPEPPHES